MPLIKYRTNNQTVKEIMVDSNTTVSDFQNIISRRLSLKVTRSVFRGKILDEDDLIRNHITNPDNVLTLLTDDSDIHDVDIMDLEQEQTENKRKKELENEVSSSLLLRGSTNLSRRGLNFTFTVYTTATPDSMLKGSKIDFSLCCKYSSVYDTIKNHVSDFHEIKYEFELVIFLPGGVHFKSGSLLDYYIDPESISCDNIYVIITKEDEIYLEEKIDEPCSCANSDMKKILSPFCKSSDDGLSQVASFLGYMFHGGLKSEHILLALAKVTRFAPLVVNLYRLIENRPICALNILAITAPLFTLFRSMLPNEVQNENVFEYTLNFLSLFEGITNTEFLKFIEFDAENEKDCEDMKQFAKYCDNTDQQRHVIIWTADTINPDFQSVIMKPEFEIVQNIFETITTFKPVQPLSLHYIFYPTFIRGNDDKNVMLFIKEVHDKENFVSIINPFEGKIKEIKIEDLAHQLNCNKKDDLFTLIDPNHVDQIIFICFDESRSMKWKMEGGNPIHNEKTRAAVASDFLEALVKQSYALRVSSFYGLISFGSEVKITQPLTAMTSDFIQSFKKINPFGKTLLYDAIDIARQKICDLVKLKNGKSRFPNSRHRIIVITDGSDNKSKTLPEKLINDLIKNEIVVDTVLVSLVDKSTECCVISKLTGGLCFMPKNFEDGINIFEQEAFLNIKMRHMKPLLYNKITPEIFSKEVKKFNDKYDSYAPNQMIINAQSKVSLATPMYMSYMSMKKKIKTYRIMRTFIELNIIAKNPNESYIVYSLHATPEEWRIFIKGPKNTPFSDKWLNLYMIIPQNYPIEPPRFRFLTIPFHPNVSSEGTVIFNLNDRDYTSSSGIDSIITGIISILKDPDVNYSINQEAMTLFKNDLNEFKKRQKNGVTGCNDYNEYLQDVKIYNQIPANVVVPEEDRGKSALISLTKDTVNKAALNGSKVKDQCLLDINDYEEIKFLGSGGFGDVYLIKDKSTGFKFAAKVSKTRIDEDVIIDYIKEVNIMSVFNHAAIAKLYGYCLKDFDNDDRHVIIMENVPNGDLESVISDERKNKCREGWDLTQKLINLYGIASGMAYSVSYGITHSDLKPANILMTYDLRPKITDFDSIRLEEEGFAQSCNMSGGDIASPLYTAPEIINGEDDYQKHAEKSDVYSFAIITYEIITARIPFERLSRFKLYTEVVKGKRPIIPNTVPEQYVDLMQACWNSDPRRRPTFKEIVDMLKQDEFLSDDIDHDRFQYYVNYIDNYKDTITESQFIRPKNQADKKKKQEKSDDVDEVLKQSETINILNLSQYKKGNVLGKGRYSEVVKVEQKATGQLFAAKISLQRVSKEVSKNILTEVNIMMSLNHPSILKFIGYSPVDFENTPKPTIITEFSSNGSLQNVIDHSSKYPGWNDTKKLIVIYGIVAGMSYLHEHKILHNDLKPSNILLGDEFHPKIADFGLSHTIANVEDASSKSVNIKGTPNYIAPEIWDDQNYTEASDMYSFGILLYELMFNKKAFHGLKPVQIGFKVTNNERPSFPVITKLKAFKSLVKKCWKQNPKDRPTFKDLLVELQDKKYISKNVNQTEYNKYIKFLNDFK